MKGSISCKYYNILKNNCLLLQKNSKFKSPHKSRNIPAHTFLYMLSVPPPCTTNIQKQPYTLVSDAHTNTHTHWCCEEALCCVLLLCCSSLVAAHPVGCLVIVTHVNTVTLYMRGVNWFLFWYTNSSWNEFFDRVVLSSSLSLPLWVSFFFHSCYPFSFCSVFCHQLFLIETDFVPSLPLILQIQTS